MRVVMLSWEYPPHLVGGLGRHVTELAAALAEEGVRVHIVTPLLTGGAEEETIAPNLEVSRVPPPAIDRSHFVTFVREMNAAMERRARELAEQHGPFSLIHAHDWLDAFAGIALQQAWQRPLVSTIHATEWGRSRGLIRDHHQRAIDGIERWLTGESRRVITVSKFMATEIREIFQLPEEKLDVIYNAVQPLSNPLSQKEQWVIRRSYARDDERIIFSVGRMVYEKGFQTLVEAMPKVLAGDPRARFVIAGTGDLRGILETRVCELGLSERVHFAGFISDSERDRLYQVADVAVFPSLYEPFGIVALEAMAARCPVVVSQTGGLQEVVRLHETGIVVYPDNPDSLAWGILHTLQHPQWAHRRAENALQMIRDYFTWQRIARQTIAVYYRVVDEWEQREAAGRITSSAHGTA